MFFVGKRAGQYAVGPDGVWLPLRGWGTDTSRSSSSYMINRPQRIIWNQWTTDFVLVKLVCRNESQTIQNTWKTIPIEVRVCGRFLIGSNVLRFPAEKEIKGLVDNAGEKGRVDDVVPKRGRGEDSLTAENEVHEGGSDMTVSRVVWEWKT